MVDGRGCVVIGSGPEADRRFDGLLARGARVTRVESTGVSPTTLEPLPWLVVATGLAEAESEALYKWAIDRRVLLCCVDRPRHCTFAHLAVTEIEPITLALGSGGRAPGLLRALREALVEGLSGEFQRFALAVADLRSAVTPDRRREVMKSATDGLVITVRAMPPAGWAERLAALRDARGDLPWEHR